MESKQVQRYQETRKATLVGATANIVLAISKVLFGWLGHSTALIADGIHSFSDLLTDVLVILAAKFSHHEADEDHPYGHERIETAATVALSIVLIIVGVAIAYDAIVHVLNHTKTAVPQTYVLWIAAFSVLVNEGIYRYTLHVAKRINSDMLKANALHSRSDAASSLVVLVGVGGSLLGVVWLDALAAIVVGAMIIKMGGSLAWQNLSELVDTGVDEETLVKIRALIVVVPGVVSLHQLRTRKMAGQILIDAHVMVASKISVSEGHHIGDQVQSALYASELDIHDVTIHIDSEDDELYSHSSQLPGRETLLPQLQSVWKSLPGSDKLIDITIHYVGGKIELELVLPLSILNDQRDEKILFDQYNAALSSFTEIKQFSLKFS